ncbi:O-acetyl-ADP-ribose deacetylase [hydrothermal vent metagenome]|uniref:O-acetyl-ADP-ribose deacetylase n=1 Tax=hydrothermal vent metagenome TaxID=652676 RepID=A0A3B1B0V8_9ZZZZ
MPKKKMEFLYGDRVLQLQICDILKAPVDVIVNPANGALMHGGGLALKIQDAAGSELEKQSRLLIAEHGELESGMAVYTSAGNLPYKAVIHAVGPIMGEGYEQDKLEQVFSRSLLLCETNDWQSIAFPAISTGVFRVPVNICAQACYKAITHFWDARSSCAVEKIIICLTENNFPDFFEAFREESFDNKLLVEGQHSVNESSSSEGKVGYIEIDENEIPEQDDEIQDWFK